jgi:hypothetical protein
MNRPGTATPAAIAFVIGAALWLLAGALTHRREPWDSGAYWLLVYPLAVAACGALGWRFPDRPWRWALVLFEAQFVTMALRSSEVGNLWPLGIALFAVLALPGIAVARWTARLRRSG